MPAHHHAADQGSAIDAACDTPPMLAPTTNAHRRAERLPDVWEFRFDPDDTGEAAGWPAGFTGTRPIAVPASWNEIFAEGVRQAIDFDTHPDRHKQYNQFIRLAWRYLYFRGNFDLTHIQNPMEVHR